MAGHLLTHDMQALSRRLYRCASFLHFREWLEHGGKTTLHSGHFCQVALLCPVCAIRRGGKMLRRYVERAAYLARTQDLWLVTLTVKNGPDLFERYAHLKHGIKRMRQRAAKGYGEFSRASGALWSTEFTNGPTGWHPHAHMVWAMPRDEAPIRYGSGSRLAADWEAITGDSHIVHAERIQADEQDVLVSAFCEVLKYALKFSTLSLDDNFHAYRQLKGQRLISSCGSWWGLDLPEDARLEDDPLDGKFIEHVYRFAGTRGYVLEQVSPGIHRNPLPAPLGTPTLTPMEHS